MGYLMTYAFMAIIAVACVGGYKLYEYIVNFYKKELGE